MTEQDLIDGERICAGATKEPWRRGVGNEYRLVYGADDRPVVVGCNAPDGKFIVHARTHYPKALAEVRRLREVLAELPTKTDFADARQIAHRVEVLWLETEVERLKLLYEAARFHVICYYCGMNSKHDGTPEGLQQVMMKHILACERHPLKQIAAQLESAETTAAKRATEATARRCAASAHDLIISFATVDQAQSVYAALLAEFGLDAEPAEQGKSYGD